MKRLKLKVTMINSIVLIVLSLQFIHNGYCLQLCPGDQIATIGDDIEWLCRQEPPKTDEWLRLYHTNDEHAIYSGWRIYHDVIEPDRCNASKDVTGAITFQISNVNQTDALMFRCRSTHDGSATDANLIILDGKPEITRKPISLDTDELKCRLKFYGPASTIVKINWLDRNGKHMDLNHGQRVSDGIESVLNVSLEDKQSWPVSCQVSFELHRQCNATIEIVTFETQKFTVEDNANGSSVKPNICWDSDQIMIVVFILLIVCWNVVITACCLAYRRLSRNSAVNQDFTPVPGEYQIMGIMV